VRAESPVLLRDRRRRAERGSVAGQVFGQAGELMVGARRVSEADPLAELLQRQPALADGVTQERDAVLSLGVGGEDGRRLGLAIVAHLQNRTGLTMTGAVLTAGGGLA
jgi:hypothetical protein